jgi:hypothetical protein
MPGVISLSDFLVVFLAASFFVVVVLSLALL